MLTKVLLVCTQGYYKSDSQRPRVTRLITEDEDQALQKVSSLKKAEDWQDERRMYHFIVKRSATCFELKDHITQEFHLPI